MTESYYLYTGNTLSLSFVGPRARRSDPLWMATLASVCSRTSRSATRRLRAVSRAVEICAAPGIVRGAIRRLEVVRETGVAGLEPVFELFHKLWNDERTSAHPALTDCILRQGKARVRAIEAPSAIAPSGPIERAPARLLLYVYKRWPRGVAGSPTCPKSRFARY